MMNNVADAALEGNPLLTKRRFGIVKMLLMFEHDKAFETGNDWLGHLSLPPSLSIVSVRLHNRSL